MDSRKQKNERNQSKYTGLAKSRAEPSRAEQNVARAEPSKGLARLGSLVARLAARGNSVAYISKQSSLKCFISRMEKAASLVEKAKKSL